MNKDVTPEQEEMIKAFEAQGMKFGKDFTEDTLKEFLGNTDEKKDNK